MGDEQTCPTITSAGHLNGAFMPYPLCTPHQKAFFEAFGYMIFPGLLREDIGWIQEEYETVWRSRPDIVHGANGSRLTSFPETFVTTTPRFSSLIEDKRIVNICETLLGDGYALNGGDGTVWDGDTSWHSDVMDEHWEAKSLVRNIKMTIYPDRLTKETGALRVIPGSHLHHLREVPLVREALSDPQRVLGMSGAQVPAVVLESEPGDVIVFDHRIKHGSFGGGKRRRQMCMNLMAPISTEQEREAMLSLFRWYRDVQKSDWSYPAGWIESSPPERIRRLQATIDLATQVRREVGLDAPIMVTQPA